MEIQTIIQWVSEYGYIALFFCLWLGFFGSPIPDEVVVMTGGMISSMGILEDFFAYLTIYFAVISGLTIGYLLGRTIGQPILKQLFKKKMRWLVIAKRLVEKYGPFALSLSYFIPGIRHWVHYILGMNGLPFYKYALYSYTAAAVWTVIFFFLGGFLGADPFQLGNWLEENQFYIFTTFVILLLAFLIWKIRKRVRRDISHGKRDDSCNG